MDPKIQLKRYLYLGTTKLYYNHNRDSLNIDTIDNYLSCIKILAEGEDPLVPLNIIKKAIIEKTLFSNNEAILALVYCIRKTENEDLRTNVYKLIPELLVNVDDLFLFIKYNIEMKKEGKGFGHGLKNAISKWYNNLQPIEMANMLMKNKKVHGFYHYQIIKLCHIKFTNEENNLIAKTLFKNNKTQVLEEYKNSEILKEKMGLSLLLNNYQLSLYNITEDKNKSECFDLIRTNKYDINQIPNNLLHYPTTWKIYFSRKQYSYQNLLHILPLLNDFRLLRKQNIANIFSFALGNIKILKKSKIHPIDILIAIRLYENHMRYLKVVKENYHKKNTNKDENNEKIILKLNEALNLSMTVYKKTGVNYYITLDLKKKLLKKPVCGMNLITCSEVAILLALSILKRKDNVTISRYTDTNVLEEISLKDSMTFSEAFDFCKEFHKGLVVHNLYLPIDLALQKKKKVDIFLTITDSIPQLCHKKIPPIRNLKKYKEKMDNNFTKYIILNLSRSEQDLKIEETNEDFLEIAGFNSEVPHIMDAFAKRFFV